MVEPDILQRLARDLHPTDAVKNRIKGRVQARIVNPLQELSRQVQPGMVQKDVSRDRVLTRVTDDSLAKALPALAKMQKLTAARQLALRERVLHSLQPVRTAWA